MIFSKKRKMKDYFFSLTNYIIYEKFQSAGPGITSQKPKSEPALIGGLCIPKQFLIAFFKTWSKIRRDNFINGRFSAGQCYYSNGAGECSMTKFVGLHTAGRSSD